MEKQQTLVHLSWSLGVGGIETLLVGIANAQAASGCQVCILVVNDLVDEGLLKSVSPAVRVILLRRRPGSKNPLALIRLNRCLRRLHPDVIHCHVGSLIRVLARPLWQKCVFTRHSVSSQGEVSRTWLQRYRKVFAISEAVRMDFEQRYRIPATVVPNGIPTGAIARRTYRRPDPQVAPVRLVTVGRLLIEVKGQDILLEAMTRLPDPALTLDIIGDGPDRGKIEALIARYGLGDRVLLRGNLPTSALYADLQRYDAFVMASRTEGFGLSVAEAMAAKLPVVVPAIEGPRELVREGRYGHLFASGDPEACAAALRALLDDYDSEAALDEASRYIRDHYALERTALRYLEEYELR